MKCVYCGSDKVRICENQNDEYEYEKMSGKDIEKGWKKIRKGDSIANYKMKKGMTKYVGEWVHTLNKPHLQATLMEVGMNAVDAAMASFEGVKASSWLSHCEKIVSSSLVLYITGVIEIEEYWCESCGFIMKFKR
ncbi:hypothetical protein bcgnr5390_13260 [Bacillus luti]|nr:hypothetical protein BC2903_51930 [Bacillus cereus]